MSIEPIGYERYPIQDGSTDGSQPPDIQDYCASNNENHDFDIATRIRALQEHGIELISCRDIDPGSLSEAPHSSLHMVKTPTSRLLMEHTSGAKPSAEPQIICLPGLSENIVHKYDKIFHDQLSTMLSGLTVTSIGANAIGIRGERDRASRETVAEERLQITEAVTDGRKVLVVGTSMGSVYETDIVNLNLDEGEPVNIQGMVYFAPAVVSPQYAKQRMLGQFFPQLSIDMTRHIHRQPMRDRLRLTGEVAMWGMQAARELPSLAHQARELVRGTGVEKIERIAAKGYPILVIVGGHDAVGELRMWQGVADKYSNIKLLVLQNHGHELPFEPRKAARKLSKEILQSGILFA